MVEHDHGFLRLTMTMVNFGRPWFTLGRKCSLWLIVVILHHGWLWLTLTMVDYGRPWVWSTIPMVDHTHGRPSFTMWIWLWWAMLIMFNHSLPCHCCIAMLIMFCSSHCNIMFHSSHCDIIFCSPHHIVKLWSSNYDEWFFFCHIMALE